MTHPADGSLEPDTKDWTWVLERPCPDCGFEASAVRPEDVGRLVTEVTDPWPEVLARPDATTRPDPGTWSPLEYGCHVRDVCRLFDERLRLMLTEHDPTFANWDQDETAVAERYGEQDPHVVGREVLEAAGVLAARFAAVEVSWWERTATRSDGSRFTALTLGRYGLHDLAHHLHDVGAARP
ncbi:DinB family protein [Phycicoccus sp. HDW14]|uniref:DinB family protein n=1 Tax=Phycicoccus sp. HDW14 TaxID=2714941 RepID=UPI00140CE81C|nr:DinB family protein [Phycicoccus sp. HDW14]QIM22256.1 DinB family protein [Phycicoccus sp. HDW14]